MKRPQKLAVMLVPTPPYEICGQVPISRRPGRYCSFRKTGYWPIGEAPTRGSGERFPSEASALRAPESALSSWPVVAKRFGVSSEKEAEDFSRRD